MIAIRMIGSVLKLSVYVIAVWMLVTAINPIVGIGILGVAAQIVSGLAA